jgi:putative addiction module antidote
MAKTIEIRQSGDSLEGTFPQDVMERLKVGAGDKLFILEGDNCIVLTPCDPKFDKVVEAYGDLSKRYSNTLRELAK